MVSMSSKAQTTPREPQTPRAPVILSERSESKDLRLVFYRKGEKAQIKFRAHRPRVRLAAVTQPQSSRHIFLRRHHHRRFLPPQLLQPPPAQGQRSLLPLGGCGARRRLPSLQTLQSCGGRTLDKSRADLDEIRSHIEANLDRPRPAGRIGPPGPPQPLHGAEALQAEAGSESAAIPARASRPLAAHRAQKRRQRDRCNLQRRIRLFQPRL